MVKKHIKYIIMLIFITSLLASCKGENKINNPDESSVSQEDQSDNLQHESSNNNNHINKKLTAGVEVDADVNILSSVDLENLSIFKAKLIIQDYEKIKNMFLMDKEIIEEQTDENSLESLTNSIYKYYKTRDDFTLSLHGADIHFGGELGGKISNLSYYMGENKLTGQDLGFKNIKDAQIEIEEIINELGIDVIQDPLCYSIDYATLASGCESFNAMVSGFRDSIREENPEQSFNIEGLESIYVDKEDECYIFIYQILNEGMPISIYSNGVFGDGSFTSGTDVRVIYSAEGIVSFRMNYQFENTEIISQNQKGITADQALDLLDKKYNTIILEGEYLVNDIVFEYVPMPEDGSSSNYILVPAWRFLVIHTTEQMGKENAAETVLTEMSNYVVFNAITGEEIIIDYGSD